MILNSSDNKNSNSYSIGDPSFSPRGSVAGWAGVWAPGTGGKLTCRDNIMFLFFGLFSRTLARKTSEVSRSDTHPYISPSAHGPVASSHNIALHRLFPDKHMFSCSILCCMLPCIDVCADVLLVCITLTLVIIVLVQPLFQDSPCKGPGF